MSKRKYRATSVKQFDAAALVASFGSRRVIVSVDVAKEDFVAALSDGSKRVHEFVKWKHPDQSRAFLRLLEQLRFEGCEVEVVMEPSGTYGDVLRFQCWQAGFPVFKVSPKRSHDLAEAYDGVPSIHDAKSAAIIGMMHVDGASRPWPIRSKHERELAAALRVLEIHENERARDTNRLEAVMARYWPEVSHIMKLSSATVLELLIEFGGPVGIAADPSKARKLMRQVGGSFLAQEKIDLVADSACSTLGVVPVAAECHLVREIAAKARRAQRLAQTARRRVEKLTQDSQAAREMSVVLGRTTAAVMVAAVGDPLHYDSPSAYQKSVGLNLMEKSSGKHQGALHITKRGSGVARMFLYLAALRLLKDDPVVGAWYAKKVKRQAGKLKSKAVIAIMRKLVLALWHVARGNPFDASKLYDVTRLDLTAAA